MSYLFYDASEEGNAQYTLYSELIFDTKISPLIQQLLQHQDLKDIEYRRYVVDAMEINYLRVALIGLFQPGPNVFDNVFPEQFLEEQLTEFRMVNGTPIRSGSRGTSRPIASSSAVRISNIHNRSTKYHRNLAKCRIDFEASVYDVFLVFEIAAAKMGWSTKIYQLICTWYPVISVFYTNSYTVIDSTNGRGCSTQELLTLADHYDLSGGSWLIHTQNFKFQKSIDNGPPTRVSISEERTKKLSIDSFLKLLDVVRSGLIPMDYFKALRWIRCDNGRQGISYVTKILNTNSSYLGNFLDHGVNKSELWYFNMDEQVSQIYRVVSNQCVNPQYQRTSYKAEVVSACNLNRRSSTDATILCLYPSLNHHTMMMTDPEDLEDEYTLEVETVARFGDVKKRYEGDAARNGGNRKFPKVPQM